MRRQFMIFIASTALLGCKQSDEGSPAEWKSLVFAGQTLTLIDEKKLEIFPFLENGTTPAVIGIKDQAVTTPILFWKIQANVLIISTFPNAEIFEELSTPSINGNVITAIRKSGTKARYKLSKHK
jgi:hypothetical protein